MFKVEMEEWKYIKREEYAITEVKSWITEKLERGLEKDVKKWKRRERVNKEEEIKETFKVEIVKV